MNITGKNCLLFILGSALGAVVSWAVCSRSCNRKYQAIANEEFLAMKKEILLCKRNGKAPEETNEAPAEKLPEKKEKPIAAAAFVPNYQSGSVKKAEQKPVEVEDIDISIISPDEYGEYEGYDRITLYYLERDQIVIDDGCHILEDISSTIGNECLNEFGNNGEADSVYVRNDYRQIDYAIFLRDKTYKNALREGIC